MATEQTITISGTPTVVSGVTVPYANTSDLEIYISKKKIESIEIADSGAGYTNRARNAAEKLIFSGGGGTAPDLWITVGQDTNNSGRIDGSIYGHATSGAALDNTNLNVGSDYVTSPNVSLTNLDGGEGGQLTASIYAKKTPVTHYTLSGTSGNTTITFEAGLLADGDKVLIKRATGVSTAANTFAAGSAITAEALNKSFDQIRYKVEELPNVTSTAVTNGVKDDIEVSGNNWTIVNDAVTSAKLADDAIDSEHYKAGSIDLEHMSANSIDSDQYVDGSIDLAHMSANSVDSDQYVDGSIDLVHMSANSVDSDQYVDGSIDDVHIANNAVTAPKIDLSIVQGDLIYGTGTDTWNRLAKGTAGQQLRINNGATAPEWATSNVQSNVYVKSYGITSSGITTPAAGGSISGNLTLSTYYDTPITVTISPQISTSLILLNSTIFFEGNAPDDILTFRIKAEVLNSSNVVQSTSYITNNYTGSAVHNSGSTANDVASSGYVNKGANLDKGIEGSNRIPMLVAPVIAYHGDDNDTTGATMVINGLLHNPGSIVSSDSTNNKIKYTVQVAAYQNTYLFINRTHDDTDTTGCERGVSWFTAQETMGSITVDTD